MPANLENFTYLHLKGRDLVLGWFDKAWRVKECQDQDSFEPFIYCYIAFNSWAACVTEKDRDRDIIHDLGNNPICESIFNITMQNDIIRCYHIEFQSLWPIFKVQEIRKKRIPHYQSPHREEIVRHYFDSNINNYTPKDPQNPKLIGHEIPLTWNNVLQSIYSVRCNLFHGDKSTDQPPDQKIVGSAFRSFVHIFKALLDFSPHQ